jgi:hypothetical protein
MGFIAPTLTMKENRIRIEVIGSSLNQSF